MHESPLPNRLRAGSPGLGEASSDEIETRARELALIDGRETASESDLSRATAELGGSPRSSRATAAPEEVRADMESLTTWDEPVDAHGRHISLNSDVDEASIGSQLIQEGVNEADHDSRVAAAEAANERD